MTTSIATKATEKLILEHTEYFRELLGTVSAVAMADSAIHPPDGRHGWRDWNNNDIPVALAVAAMAGAWPKRLEQEHGLIFTAELIEDADWGTPHAIMYTFYRPQGVSMRVVGQGWSRVGAICATVKALVLEKRAREAEPSLDDRIAAAKPHTFVPMSADEMAAMVKDAKGSPLGELSNGARLTAENLLALGFDRPDGLKAQVNKLEERFDVVVHNLDQILKVGIDSKLWTAVPKD